MYLQLYVTLRSVLILCTCLSIKDHSPLLHSNNALLRLHNTDHVMLLGF